MACRLPALVVSGEGRRDELNFYNVVDNSKQVKRLPGLDMHGTDMYMSTPVDGGWVLFQDRDSEQLSLFNLTSFERIAVPPLDDETDNFTFLLPYPPSHPNSALVAVHESKPYYLQFHPGKEKPSEFTKHTFHDDIEFYPNNSATYQGKVFVVGVVTHLIDPVTEAVENMELRCPPSQDTNAQNLGHFDFYSRFVEADGDLFMVNWCSYSDSYVLQSMDVLKLDLPNREWIKADVSDRVFFMGKSCSLVCSASATAGGIKGNRIYFVDDVTYEQLCCYDLDYGRLTTCLPYPDSDIGVCACPCWVMLDQDVEQQENTDEEESDETSSSCSEELEVEVKKRLVLGTRDNEIPAAKEKSPCLLFTHKNDGEYILLEPFTKSHCTLHLPQLAGSLLYSSAFDGWLVVRQTKEVAFLFNLLTSEVIELPSLKSAGMLYHLALSSPPTSTDSMLFAIAREEEAGTVKIIFCRIGDPDWTVLQFSDPFSPANTNAVFYKGVFLCLGRDGALGVYDHNRQTWTVLDDTRLEKEQLPFVVSQCCLVQKEDKLLSVFMDEYNSPREVFQFGDGMEGWEKATDFGDELLFLGRYSSFWAPALDEQSKNLICLQKFAKEDDYDPIFIDPWDDGCFYNNTSYTINPCWVEVSTSGFHGLVDRSNSPLTN